MTANAAAVTKLLKRYNFSKASFATRQVSKTAWVYLEDSIAYDSSLYARMIEVIAIAGYSVEPSGRKVLKVAKVGA